MPLNFKNAVWILAGFPRDLHMTSILNLNAKNILEITPLQLHWKKKKKTHSNFVWKNQTFWIELQLWELIPRNHVHMNQNTKSISTKKWEKNKKSCVQTNKVINFFAYENRINFLWNHRCKGFAFVDLHCNLWFDKIFANHHSLSLFEDPNDTNFLIVLIQIYKLKQSNLWFGHGSTAEPMAATVTTIRQQSPRHVQVTC